MKRIIVTVCLFFGLFLSGMAQTSTSKADEKAAKEAQKKADKEKKKAEKDAAKSTGTNKDGSPDMRLKKNKDAKANADKAKNVVQPPAPAPAAKPTQPAVTPPVKPAPMVTPPTVKPTIPPVKPVIPAVATPGTTDKVIGTDDKGRTIYEGKRCGHYYINKNGNKEYVKKS